MGKEVCLRVERKIGRLSLNGHEWNVSNDFQLSQLDCTARTMGHKI